MEQCIQLVKTEYQQGVYSKKEMGLLYFEDFLEKIKEGNIFISILLKNNGTHGNTETWKYFKVELNCEPKLNS